MNSDKYTTIPRTTLRSLLSDISALSTGVNHLYGRVNKLATRSLYAEEPEAYRYNLYKRHGIGLGGAVMARRGWSAVCDPMGYGERGGRYGVGGGEDDSFLSTSPEEIWKYEDDGYNNRINVPHGKRKRPNGYFRGGMERGYGGKHWTPNITRAPPESRNARAEARRGGRGVRRARPSSTTQGDEEDTVDDGSAEMEVVEHVGMGEVSGEMARGNGSEDDGDGEEENGVDKGGEGGAEMGGVEKTS